MVNCTVVAIFEPYDAARKLQQGGANLGSLTPGNELMSNLEQLSQSTPKHEQSTGSKFHLELSLNDKQIKETEYSLGAALCAATIGVIAVKTGKFALAEKVFPELESAVNACYAGVLRKCGAAPRLNYYELKNGLEMSYSPNGVVNRKVEDIVSIAHPLNGEAHLLRDGGRMVLSSGGEFGEQFFNDNGKLIEASFPSRKQPLVWYQSNPVQTALSKKAFSKIEDSFFTGYTKPVERWADLFDQVTKL